MKQIQLQIFEALLNLPLFKGSTLKTCCPFLALSCSSVLCTNLKALGFVCMGNMQTRLSPGLLVLLTALNSLSFKYLSSVLFTLTEGCQREPFRHHYLQMKHILSVKEQSFGNFKDKTLNTCIIFSSIFVLGFAQ